MVNPTSNLPRGVAVKPVASSDIAAAPTVVTTPVSSTSSDDAGLAHRDANTSRQPALVGHGGAANPVLAARTADIVPQQIAPQVLRAIDRINGIMVKKLVTEGQSAAFSATGVMGLMMLAANGTEEGPERDAYLKELGLEGMSVDDVNAQARAISHKFANVGEGATVSTGNLVVTNQSKTGGFEESFSRGAVKGLDTKVIDRAMGAADYGPVADEINQWVNDSTKGLIEEFTDEGQVADTLWSLMNAIAFDIEWLNAFSDADVLLDNPDFDELIASGSTPESQEFREKAANFVGKSFYELSQAPAKVRAEVTQVAEASKKFTTGAGDVKDVDMMHLTESGLRMFDGPDFQAVMLPSKAEGVYMVAMLPEVGTSPAKLLASLDGDAFRESVTTASSSGADDTIRMPAFAVDFEPDGVLDALREVAPLSFGALTKAGPQSPNHAKLKAVLKVGREGASGAQVVAMSALESMVWPQTVEFNRPFAYAFVTKDGDPIMRGTFEG